MEEVEANTKKNFIHPNEVELSGINISLYSGGHINIHILLPSRCNIDSISPFSLIVSFRWRRTLNVTSSRDESSFKSTHGKSLKRYEYTILLLLSIYWKWRLLPAVEDWTSCL